MAVAATPVVADLLATCVGLKALVTSRVVLHLREEQEYPVPPLKLPEIGCPPGAAMLERYSAIELFVHRAQSVKPGFTLTNENAPAVARICAYLDGLPLAIELGVARIRLLSPQAMLDRLGKRLDFLKGGPRDLPARHQTLRQAIAWSYDLLTDNEKAFFRWLAIFTGGWPGASSPALRHSMRLQNRYARPLVPRARRGGVRSMSTPRYAPPRTRGGRIRGRMGRGAGDDARTGLRVGRVTDPASGLRMPSEWGKMPLERDCAGAP